MQLLLLLLHLVLQIRDLPQLLVGDLRLLSRLVVQVLDLLLLILHFLSQSHVLLAQFFHFLYLDVKLGKLLVASALLLPELRKFQIALLQLLLCGLQLFHLVVHCLELFFILCLVRSFDLIEVLLLLLLHRS